MLQKVNVVDTIPLLAGEELESRGILPSEEIQAFVSQMRENSIFILGGQNRIFGIQQEKVVFDDVCCTSLGDPGFGVEPGSKGTPMGAHKIHSFIGDGAEEFRSFVGRVENELLKPSDYGAVIRSIVGRIIQIDGMEKTWNDTTLNRYVYIHGTPNTWYWETDNLRRTHGCMSLPPHKMIELFNIFKDYKNTVVYITDKSEL